MRKNKIIKSIISLAAFTPIAAIVVPMSSCGNKTKETYTKIKLNTNVAPRDLDLNDTTIPLTYKNTSDNVICIRNNYTLAPLQKYTFWFRTSMNDGTDWGKPSSCGSTGFVQLQKGQMVQIFGINHDDTKSLNNETQGLNLKIDTISTIGSAEQRIVLGGSLASLTMDEEPFIDDGAGNLVLNENAKGIVTSHAYRYRSLFEGSNAIYGVSPQLLLPYDVSRPHIFDSMFKDCSILKFAPTIPSSLNIGEYSCAHMFENCSALETAPYLPAIYLSEGCYSSLFAGCSKLNCISLNYVGNFLNKYFAGWVNNVSSSGLFFYNGVDTTQSSSEFPIGWTQKTNETIQKNVKVIEFKADSESSQIVGKTKVAGYKNQSAIDLVDENKSPIKYQPLISGDAFDGLYNGDTKLTIDESTTFESLPDSITPKYGWTPIIVQSEKYINAVFYKKGWIQNTAYNKHAQTVEYCISQATKQNPTWQPQDSDWKKCTTAESIEAHSVVLIRSRGTNKGFTTGTDGAGKFGHDKYQSIKLTLFDKSNIGKGIALKGHAYSLLADNSGNISDDNKITIPDECCFTSAFEGSDITDIDKDFLPFTTLKSGCYNRMFQNCTYLKNTPLLPALTLPKITDIESNRVGGPYGFMFYNCANLQYVRQISATSFAMSTENKQYKCIAMSDMFHYCSSLAVYNDKSSDPNYINFFTVPKNVQNDGTDEMLSGTCGNVKGSPSANTKLYCLKTND